MIKDIHGQCGIVLSQYTWRSPYKKGECSYGLASIDKFPTCNLVRNAFLIKQDDYEGNIYLIYSSSKAIDMKQIDFTNKLAKIK